MIYDYLFDWQKNIVNKFKDRESFGLYLDMGLGKTPTSLALAEANDCNKLIVITINSKATEDVNVGGSWFDWASKSKLSYSFYNKSSFKKDINGSFIKTPEMLLLNYESLYNRSLDRKQRVVLKPYITNFIKNCKNENVAIIVDESHKMKDLQSLQTGAIMKIKQQCQLVSNKTYLYLLSGSPFTTGYIDLYSQLKALGWNSTKANFMDQFCVRGNIPGLLGYQQPIVGYRNVNQLYDLIHKFAITIKSEEVIDLPEKIFVDHQIPESEEFKLFTHMTYPCKLINEELSRRGLPLETSTNKSINNPFFRNYEYPDLKWLAETNGSFWMRSRQLSIGFQGNAEESKWYDKTRVQLLKEFLTDNEDNYLLFYNYTPELIELYDMCSSLGYNVDVYSGEVKSMIFYDKYEKQTEEQRLTNKKNIILANFASGSTGMNWQLYNKCILFSVPLYKDFEQGIKRINRIGTKDTCIYHTFYQDNFLDRSMLKSLKEARQYNQDMFDSDLKRIQSEIVKGDKNES